MARRAYAVGAAFLAAVALYLTWPSPLGGATTYVVTSGVSMRPFLHSGDLAILRRDNDYTVGDVAGYRSATLKVTVLHRIIDRRGDRFVLKGDSNTWLDADEPQADEILGRLVVRIPRGGIALQTLSHPAVLLSAAGLVALAGGTSRRRRGRRRRGAGSGSPGPRDRDAQAMAVTASSAVAGALALMAALTWVIPLRQDLAARRAIEHRATMTYTGAVARDSVYPTGAVQLPDPIFLRLVPALDVSIDYQGAQPDAATATPRAAVVAGSYTMSAQLRGGNGWRRLFPLTAPTSFRGDNFSAKAVLPLRDLSQAVSDLQRLTGVPGGPYTVVVTTQIDLEQTEAGRSSTEEFAPELTFELDPNQLRLRDKPSQDDTFIAATKLGPMVAARAPPDWVPSRQVAIAARFGVTTLAFSAFATTLVLRHRRRAASRQVPTRYRIPRRYRQRIVSTLVASIPEDRAILAVESLDALNRIAEKCERFIHYEATTLTDYGVEQEPHPWQLDLAREHTFFVDDDTALYVFVTGTVEALPEPAPTPVGPTERIPRPRHAARATSRKPGGAPPT